MFSSRYAVSILSSHNAERVLYKLLRTKVFSIWNHHKCLGYVSFEYLCYTSMDIINICTLSVLELTLDVRIWVYWREILTSKVGPRAVSVKPDLRASCIRRWSKHTWVSSHNQYNLMHTQEGKGWHNTRY